MRARMRFERELDDLAMPEYQWQSGPQPIEKAVGQRVVLDLDQTAFAADIDSPIQWSIPGIVVRGYEGTVTRGATIEMSAADRQGRRISFFWLDRGTGRVVLARFRTKSGASVQFSSTFNIYAPKIESFTAKKTGVTRMEKRSGLVGMRFGDLAGVKGVEWDWTVAAPDRFGGFVKDVQTVVNDRWKLQRLSPGSARTRKLVWRHPRKTTAHMQLDGHKDAEAVYNSGLPTEVGAGGSFHAKGISDSPHTSLERLSTIVSVNDRFTYFIMFRPEPSPGQTRSDTIWVPLARATWSWQAIAKRNAAGAWVINQKQMKPQFVTEGDATTGFPVYESNAAENEWQEVP